MFPTAEDVTTALKQAEQGELYNIQFLVQTVLTDLLAREKKTGKLARLVLVLDESGQWVEDDAGRLTQLQALVEEAAIKGQGKLWVFVTTHEDMGAVYAAARALKADMHKIEDRFRFRFSLTTENIELVLQDRIFKKRLAGRQAVEAVYDAAPGVLRGLGELANCQQQLPDCTRERFTTFYPFFPYQVHLVPEIVKSLRSAGARGEQLSGSTRTLLAITQDVLRAGRRPYLQAEVSEIVSFDEIYGNLAGEEVHPDVRRELARIEEVVPGATALTRRVAEVLYLIREIPYVPRTVDNLSRMLVESTTDDLPTLVPRVEAELKRLMAAKMVARIGEEYEFLTGVRRTFEDELATVAAGYKYPDKESGFAKHFIHDRQAKRNHLREVLGFETVPYKGKEFPIKMTCDGTVVADEGHIEVRVVSPLAVLTGTKLSEVEDQSLRSDEQRTIFIVADRIPGFDQDLVRYLAMREVVETWKQDPYRSEEAKKLAVERETNDLDKLRRRVLDGFRDALKRSHVVFQGSSRALNPRQGTSLAQALQGELASYWPTLYPKFEKVPVRISQEQRAIREVLAGATTLSQEVKDLKLYDKGGQLDPNSPLLDAIRVHLATSQAKNRRIIGKTLIEEFSAPPYGWDRNAVRVGVAALLRAGQVRVLVNKRPYTNPLDPDLQAALVNIREFDRVELVLEEADVRPEVLTQVRSALMKLTAVKKIDETPAALHQIAGDFCQEKLARAEKAALWAEASGFPLPAAFQEGREAMQKLLSLTSPIHRVNELHGQIEVLKTGAGLVDQLAAFHEKWGKAFSELRTLVGQLRAVEHRLPPSGQLVSLLREFSTAERTASLADAEVWKTLQGAKATASLELGTLLDEWRAEARDRVQRALEQLPQALAGAGLPAELEPKLAGPMTAFLETADGETDPARVAALPDRAGTLVTGLGQAIRDEVARRQTREEPPPVPRPVRRVRLADVALTGRVRTESEWSEIRDRLDAHVRKLLAEGNEVELG